jgi:hypothetical protein
VRRSRIGVMRNDPGDAQRLGTQYPEASIEIARAGSAVTREVSGAEPVTVGPE